MTLELFIGNLLRSVEVAKLFHLEAFEGKQIVHEALDDYYTKATNIVDAIYEETMAVIPLAPLEYSYTRLDFETPSQFLQFIDKFIINNKLSVYDEKINSNIHGHLDELTSVIRSTIYKVDKLSEALEQSTQEKAAIKKLQAEYLSDDLTYNGIQIRTWFEERKSKYAQHIEDILNREYRTVSQSISGVFFSNLHKDFIIVMKSYRKEHHALARTKMIEIFVPEPVKDIQFFKATTNEELVEYVQEIDTSMTPLFVNVEIKIEEV